MNKYIKLTEEIQVKNNKFTDKKLMSIERSRMFSKLSNKYPVGSDERYKKVRKYKRMIGCGSWLKFVNVENKLKLHSANFCKIRLCPMCAWRRSLKIFKELSLVMNKIEQEKEYRYLFLTLTVKNVYADELRSTISHLLKSFNAMTRYKKLKPIKGYFRALEVTYNEQENTYHPHIHVILAVNKSYFGDNKAYISQKEFTELWKKAAKLDYTPIVDVRRIKSKNGSKLSKAVLEVSKYTVKDTDIKTSDVLEVLDYALKNVRLIGMGGIFKEYHSLLNLEQEDKISLTDDVELRDDIEQIIITYRWSVGFKNYIAPRG